MFDSANFNFLMSNAGHFCYCVSIKLGFHASSAIYFKRKNDNYFQLGFNLTLIYISLMPLCIRLTNIYYMMKLNKLLNIIKRFSVDLHITNDDEVACIYLMQKKD